MLDSTSAHCKGVLAFKAEQRHRYENPHDMQQISSDLRGSECNGKNFYERSRQLVKILFVIVDPFFLSALGHFGLFFLALWFDCC